MEIRCNRLTGSCNAVQDAIDALPPEGGTVTVPAGDWPCSPLRLRSGLTLCLEKGARILFDRDTLDTLGREDFLWCRETHEAYLPLVYACDCEDITITGAGILEGDSEYWKGSGETPKAPSVLGFRRCSRINFKGLTIQDTPLYAICLSECTQAAIRNLRIRSACPHGGGFVVDSCRDVLIDSCSIAGGTDGIRIASTTGICQGVGVRRCVCDGGRYALYAGLPGCTGLEKLYVHDCILRNSDTGIRIDLPEGILHDVRFESLQVIDMKDEGLQITVNGEDVPEPEGLSFRNIYGSAAAENPVNLSDLPAKLLDKILMRNVHVVQEPALALNG